MEAHKYLRILLDSTQCVKICTPCMSGDRGNNIFYLKYIHLIQHTLLIIYTMHCLSTESKEQYELHNSAVKYLMYNMIPKSRLGFLIKIPSGRFKNRGLAVSAQKQYILRWCKNEIKNDWSKLQGTELSTFTLL